MSIHAFRHSALLLAVGTFFLFNFFIAPPLESLPFTTHLSSAALPAPVQPTSLTQFSGNSHVIIGALTCISATQCLAAGEGVTGSTTTEGMVYLFNGIQWVPMATNDITQVNGQILNGIGTLPAVIHGISCASATSCWVVGSDAGGNFLAHLSTNGFVPHPWNYPDTSNSVFQPISTALYSIDCPEPSQCWAAGSSATGALILHYDGSGWQSVPEPFDATSGALLQGISCTSPISCIAVGTRIEGLSGQAIETIWNGKVWKSGPSEIAYTSFTHISCTKSACLMSALTASDAMLVDIPSKGGKTTTLIQHLASISSISCVRSGICTVSGMDSRGAILLEGNTFKWHSLPLPFSGTNHTATSPIGYCTSEDACTVVENTRSRAGEQAAIPAIKAGTQWTVGIQLSVPNIANEEIAQSACAPDGYCLAEQSATTSVQNKPDALYSISGSHVAEVPIPTPFNYTYDSFHLMNCLSALQCFGIVVTVSFQTLPNGNEVATYHAAIVRWNGADWFVLSTGELPGDSVEGYCVSTTLCWFSVFSEGTTPNLPGNPPHPSYNVEMFRMNNHSWDSVQLPQLSDETQLTTISCAGPSFCMAGGEENNSQLLLAYQSGVWKIIPTPTNTTWTLSLDCVAPNNCWMVNAGSTVSIDHFTGTAQVIQMTSESYIPSGISCTSAVQCYWVTDTRTATTEQYKLESDHSGIITTVSTLTESQLNFSPRDILNGLSCTIHYCYATGYTIPWIHISTPVETMQSIPLLESFYLDQ